MTKLRFELESQEVKVMLGCIANEITRCHDNIMDCVTSCDQTCSETIRNDEREREWNKDRVE